MLPELIKLKFDEVQNIMLEQERSVRTEMENLVRERDSLEKKTVEMKEEIQKLRREKADVENKCEDADQRVEELRRENKQLRVKMKESHKLRPRLSEEDVDLPDFDENAGIGSSNKGSNCRTPMVRNFVRECKLERIDVIKDNLHKENLERFEQSCFGHLLRISDDRLKFQGQLILHLLLHMDKRASTKGGIVFTFKNSKIEFGLREFSHITGLNYLGTSRTTTSSSIHKGVFQSRLGLRVKDIEEAFLKVSRDNGGRGELTLKLALLYFLYGTLLGNHRRNVDMEYLHLIDDLNKFNAFPWGRVAYELLASTLSALRGRMDGVAVTDRTLVGPNIGGFTFALQIWAYEVMPFVAASCASRAHNFDKGSPPILHWHATKTPQFSNLKELFTPGYKARVLIKPLTMPKEKKMNSPCDEQFSPSDDCYNGERSEKMDSQSESGQQMPTKKGSRISAHSVKTEDCSEPVAAARDNQGKEPEMRGRSRASATCLDGDQAKMRFGDDDGVIVISDSSDDEALDADYGVGEDSNSILNEQDSDNDSCSDSYMNTLVAKIHSRKKRQKKDI